jgi:protein ImuA
MATTAVAQETFFALRDTIARLEGKLVPTLHSASSGPGDGQISISTSAAFRSGRMLATGSDDLDKALEGGLPLDGLTEIRSSALRDGGASTGFAMALAARLRAPSAGAAGMPSAVLWIGETVVTLEAGLPYALGLRDFGVSPQGVLHAVPRKLDEALWLAELALSSAAFSLVVLEIRGNPAHFGLTESRRLSLRAKAAGRPLFVLRQAGEEEASSAAFRLQVEPAPALLRSLPDGTMLSGSIGHPAFRLTLEKSRNPAPLTFILEWNAHERRFSSIDPSIPFGQRPAAHSGSQLSASSDRSDRPQALGSVLAFNRAS